MLISLFLRGTTFDPRLLLLGEFVLRACLLLAVALSLVWLMRRSSASSRHALLLSTFLGLVILPVCSFSLPKLPLLPPLSEAAKPVLSEQNHVPNLVIPESFETASAIGSEIAPSAVQVPPLGNKENVALAQSEQGSVESLTSQSQSVQLSLFSMMLIVWGVGSCLFLVRIVWGMLRLASIRGTEQPGKILEALQSKANSMGMPVPRLLIPGASQNQQNPMVFGIFRKTLVLPAEAVGWTRGRMDAILAHELAHLKRNDPASLLLAHLVCSFYWFIPFVWQALGRLRLEQDLACDDRVLVQGMKPSTYAEHLLALTIKPAAVSLAATMASSSQLKLRVEAILDPKRVRSLTGRMLLVRILLGIAGVTGFLGSLDAAEPYSKSKVTKEEKENKDETVKKEATDKEPEKKLDAETPYGKEYLETVRWRQNKDGTFPDAALDSIRSTIKRHLKSTQKLKDEELAKKWLEEVKFEKPISEAEFIKVIDEVGKWQDPVLGWSGTIEKFAEFGSIKGGRKLTKKEEKLPWGPEDKSGLRAAVIVDPAQEEYPHGEILKLQVIYHNAGTKPVQFVTETWLQGVGWNAKDGAGNKIDVQSTWFSGITPWQRYVLQPGEAIEVRMPGAAVGTGTYEEEFSTATIATILPLKEGDEFEFTLKIRVPGFESSDGEGVKTVPIDKDNVTNLETGSIKFRVTAPDPKAALRIRTAVTTGRYVLGKGAPQGKVHLLVNRTSLPELKYTNSAVIAFLSEDPKVPAKFEPYKIELPDGLESYRFAWQRETQTLWLATAAGWKKFEFQDPAQVEVSELEPDSEAAQKVPAEIQAELTKFMAPAE